MRGLLLIEYIYKYDTTNNKRTVIIRKKDSIN